MAVTKKTKTRCYMKKLNLAVIGQGRSGKDIHGYYYLSDRNEYFNVKYVVDADEGRREISKSRYPGCEVFADYHELFDKTDIDLVVNSTYSEMHYAITKELLEHKFNVLCEKPLARTRYECDDLILTAKKNGVLFTVFQQTFYAPYYRDVLKVIEDGTIGDVLQVSIRFNGLSRRWDWQTLQKKMAGSAYNTGPHPFGIALGVLGFDKDARVAYSRLESSPLTSGDSDDYCKAIIVAPGKPTVDVEINSQDAYSSYNVKLQGTRGTFKCTTNAYECKYIVEGENPERPVVDTFLQDSEGNPIYCSEKLVTHEMSGDYDGTAFDVGTAELYKNIYYALTEGREMYVTAEMARDIIALIETLHANSPMKLEY